MKNINFPVSRIWTKKELNLTLKEARKANLEIVRPKNSDMVEIHNPENDDVILRSVPLYGKEMVRYNYKYFKKITK